MRSLSLRKLMHIVSDFTGEGIDRNAALNEKFDGYRTGFLLTTDEGRQLMGGDRYKSGSGSAGSKYTLDKLKRAWDGKGPSAVRGNKSLERNYERIRLGVLAFIQPEVYDEIASDETDDACGFWPRFLAYEAAPVQLRDDLTPADRRHIASNSSFRGYLSKLYGAIHELTEDPLNGLGEVEFQFSEEAEDWWYQHQCQIGRESTREAASGDGVMGRLLGKLPAQVLDVCPDAAPAEVAPARLGAVAVAHLRLEQGRSSEGTRQAAGAHHPAGDGEGRLHALPPADAADRQTAQPRPRRWQR